MWRRGGFCAAAACGGGGLVALLRHLGGPLQQRVAQQTRQRDRQHRQATPAQQPETNKIWSKI